MADRPGPKKKDGGSGKSRRPRRRRKRGGGGKKEGGERKGGGRKGGARKAASGEGGQSGAPRRGRRGRRGKRRPVSTYRVLGRTVEEMTARFGEPQPKTEKGYVWVDGKEIRSAVRLECLLDEDAKVKTARIIPPMSKRMSPDEVLRWIGRYNGGNVTKPERQPHVFAGGAHAIQFKDDHWAFVQRDPVGNVYGIKIWSEPLDPPVSR